MITNGMQTYIKLSLDQLRTWLYLAPEEVRNWFFKHFCHDGEGIDSAVDPKTSETFIKNT